MPLWLIREQHGHCAYDRPEIDQSGCKVPVRRQVPRLILVLCIPGYEPRSERRDGFRGVTV